jgi:acetyl esterase/lipase
MSLLSLFNAVSPKDQASHRVASAIAYGHQHRQMLDVYAPRVADRPLPVVIFLYGGSWDSGDRRDYEFAGRAFAALGYVTVVPDHRLLPEIQYPVFLDDLTLAFAWVAAHASEFGGDPRRIALVGHSAGAYNAAMLALAPDYLQAKDLRDRLVGVACLSGPFDFFPFTDPISQRVFGAVPDGSTTQPINYVTSGAPPMLLAHGADDTLVSPNNAKSLAARLRQSGVPVAELFYPGVAHILPMLALSTLLRWRLPVLADVGAFLGQVMSAAPASRGIVIAGPTGLKLQPRHTPYSPDRRKIANDNKRR